MTRLRTASLAPPIPVTIAFSLPPSRHPSGNRSDIWECQLTDRSTIIDQLALAEEHVAVGERSIYRQRNLIAEIEKQGYDATEERRMLTELEKLLAQHIAERDGLRRHLADDHD